MKLMPSSLVGRMTLLVVAVGVLSLMLHIGVMALWLNALIGDMASAIAGRTRISAQVLAEAPSEQREVLARSLGDERFGMHPLRGPWPEPGPKGPPLAGELVVALLSQLPAGSEVRLPPPDAVEPAGALTLLVPVDGQTWVFTQRLDPPAQALLGTGLGWLLLVAVAVFASLGLGVRFIARPITVLAERLLAQGSRITPVQPIGGATEIQVLTTAFNRLALAVRQADEDRQHLLAGVSHDLRTPLARLRLRIETQLDSDSAEELLADTDALERIVGQFLAYVQGDSGAGLGQADTVSAVMHQVVAGYAEQGLPVQALPGGPACDWPDLALQRVLSNLIDNALAYGGAPVEVSLTEREGALGQEYVLAVSDSGAGMDEAQFQRAQQPFVRLEGAAAATQGHCGLGLAIVARLAQQLNARLERGREADGRFAVRLVWARSPTASARQG